MSDDMKIRKELSIKRSSKKTHCCMFEMLNMKQVIRNEICKRKSTEPINRFRHNISLKI